MSNKHAYLIMAHNEFYVLEKLLTSIDDNRNDIYIHIDKKISNVDFENLKKCCKKSNVIFTDRIKVNWGGFSQIESELILLKVATTNKYAYYHIISGVDLPIKSQNYIHCFFDNNNGKEFIGYKDEWDINRIKYLYFLNENLRGKSKINNLIVRCLNRITVFGEKILGYDNVEKFNGIIFKKGPNWVSITHQCAELILSKEILIRKMFKYSICADEVFIQTIYYNFSKEMNLYGGKLEGEDINKRFIDWERGEPYTFTEEDFEQIINSDQIFARKFSKKVDKNIIDRIVKYLLSQ